MSCPKNKVRDLLLKHFIMDSTSSNRHTRMHTQETLQPETGPIKCTVHRFCGLFCNKTYVFAPRKNQVLLSLDLLKWLLISVVVLPLALMRSQQYKHVNSYNWPIQAGTCGGSSFVSLFKGDFCEMFSGIGEKMKLNMLELPFKPTPKPKQHSFLPQTKSSNACSKCSSVSIQWIQRAGSWREASRGAQRPVWL